MKQAQNPERGTKESSQAKADGTTSSIWLRPHYGHLGIIPSTFHSYLASHSAPPPPPNGLRSCWMGFPPGRKSSGTCAPKAAVVPGEHLTDVFEGYKEKCQNQQTRGAGGTSHCRATRKILRTSGVATMRKAKSLNSKLGENPTHNYGSSTLFAQNHAKWNSTPLGHIHARTSAAHS